MSAYYDLLEKPDIRRTGEQQPLYAHFVAKGTIDRKEFIDRVHLFTGISRSVRWQRSWTNCAIAWPTVGR